MTKEMKRIIPSQVTTIDIEDLKELHKYYEKLVHERIIDDLKLISEKSAILTEIIERQTPNSGGVERAQMIFLSDLISFVSTILQRFISTSGKVTSIMKRQGHKTSIDYV